MVDGEGEELRSRECGSMTGGKIKRVDDRKKAVDKSNPWENIEGIN